MTTERERLVMFWLFTSCLLVIGGLVGWSAHMVVTR